MKYFQFKQWRPFNLASAWTMVLISSKLMANPFHDPKQVPADRPNFTNIALNFSATPVRRDSRLSKQSNVIRIDVDWVEANDSFELNSAKHEQSGTEHLYIKSRKIPKYGSFIGILEGPDGQKTYSALGTGKEFRKLSRGLSFRFPYVTSTAIFTLLAEDPITGEMKERLKETIEPDQLRSIELKSDLDIRLIKKATASPAIQVVAYAEGYLASGKDRFFHAAKKAAASFADSNLPTYANMEITAVFAPSKTQLGTARDLGLPVPERDSFLGLYYPYWNNFGRWYHVVYPTQYQKYRNALAQVPYDYPLAIVESNAYWGVGNYMELTAIPSESTSFRYLLLHEFGHFLGLNEEYEGGGRTELEFAPEILEPWSQNITFAPERHAIKWGANVKESTPLPTPQSLWNGSQNGPIGAYKGGYADSSVNKSYKPGYACIMEQHSNFCVVCRQGIVDEFLSALYPD